MSGQLAGVGVALLASALYGLAVGLQAFEARQVPAEHRLRLSLFQLLARRPLWITGAATGLLGWVLQAVALSFAPLTLVEPTLAATLVFVLVIGARALDERVRLPAALCVLAVAAGVAGLGLVAPHHHARHGGGSGFVFVLAGLGAVVVAPRALAARRRSPALVAVGAGVAYAFVGLSTKFAMDDASTGAYGSVAGWLAVLGIVGALGLLNEMSALQLSPVTQVTPIVFGLNMLLPVVLAPVLAHESWSRTPSARTTLVLSLAAVAAGLLGLSRSGVVSAFLEGGSTPGTVRVR